MLREDDAMPMIDIYAVAGTFANPKQLAMDAATTVKTIEGVPDIPMFRKNTAAFVHELPAGTLANVDGDETYVRVQVLDRKSTRLNSSHPSISYAVFCLKKKK